MIIFKNSVFQLELCKFMVVGSIGFCIDGGLLTLLMKIGWEVISARLLSFLMSVTVTWLLNRLWTFRINKSITAHREYAYYFGIQTMGASINISIFYILIDKFPPFRDTPVIPLGFSAVASLAFNYIFSKITVFKR